MNRTHSTTLKHVAGLTAAAMLLTASLEAHAIPIQLSSAQFATEIASAGSIVVETFESMNGANGNPLAFSNGTITSDDTSTTAQVLASGTFCGSVLDNCLLTGVIADTRTIDALPTGTTHWGASMYFIRPTDLMEITVTGGSGVLSFTATASSFGGFLGFSDALGITSLTFHDLGTPPLPDGGSGNYTFDNVTTAGQASVSVPEPATLSLLGAGLIALGLARRRRGVAGKPAR